MRVAVIGAGLFGCSVALELDRCGHDVALIERDGDIMQHASQHNHSRVHAGYHYPRSLLTCQQSLSSMASFLVHFKDAVITSVPNFYAIAKHDSRIKTDEFVSFCDESGLTLREAYPNSELLDRSMIDGCFAVDEPMFDYQTLYSIVKQKLNNSRVKLLLNERIISTSRGLIPEQCFFIDTVNNDILEFDWVVNATYANINTVNDQFGVHRQRILYEDVTIPVLGIEMPKVGLTVMDGEFCTLMPNGNEVNQFLLYHVNSSVRCRSEKLEDVRCSMNEINDNISSIYSDSTTYFPFLKHVKRISCRRTIRAVHENSADARLSEIHTYKERPGYVSILSGKISTAIQTAIHVRCLIENKQIYTRYYL